MIEIQNISKRYGAKYAVKDVTFTIPRGEILGFLGRNGAGKTTTMNIVTGYISSSAGRVLLDGHDILEEPQLVKRHIGYLPEHPPLYLDMTVQEYLSFVCDIKDVRKHSQKPHIDDICELVKVVDVRHRLIKNLSKGYRQRVGLAQALVGNPDIIILDEPTVGLDPRQIIEIRNLIKDLGKDHTVVLSSHILHEVSDVCERVVIINQGQIVAQDTLTNLRMGVDEVMRLNVRIAGDTKRAFRVLRDVGGVHDVEQQVSKEEGSMDFTVECDRGMDVRKQMFNQIGAAGMHIMMLQNAAPTLEDIFLELTQDKEAVI